jgi:hypothetical protein
MTGSLAGYRADLRWPVPPSCLLPSILDNPKLAAIAAHRSQVHDNPQSYLFSFARSDEAFFSERLWRDHEGLWASGSDPHRLRRAEFEFDESERRNLTHDTPLSLEVTTRRPEHGRPLRISFLEGPRGRYVLLLDGDGERARLYRQVGERTRVELQDWLLPHDVWERRSSEFELEIARPSTAPGVAELSLSLDGELIGQAIDVAPLERGASLSVEYPPRGPEEVTVALYE